MVGIQSMLKPGLGPRLFVGLKRGIFLLRSGKSIPQLVVAGSSFLKSLRVDPTPAIDDLLLRPWSPLTFGSPENMLVLSDLVGILGTNPRRTAGLGNIPYCPSPIIFVSTARKVATSDFFEWAVNHEALKTYLLGGLRNDLTTVSSQRPSLENLKSILGDLRAEQQKAVFLLDASVNPSVSSFSFLQAAKKDNEDLAIIRATEVNQDGLILRPESMSSLIDNFDEDGSRSRKDPRDFRRPELFRLRRQPIRGFSLAMLDVVFLGERLESFISSAEENSTEPSLEGFWGFLLNEARGRTATHGCALAFPAGQKDNEGVRGGGVKDKDLLGEPDSPLNIVVIDAQPPEPDKDSGSLVARRLMEYATSQMTRVFFISTTKRNSSHRGNLALASAGAQVLSEDFFPRVEDGLDFVSRRVDGRVVFVLNRVTSGGLYFDYVKRNFPSSRIIFNTVDLHSLRELRQASQSNDFKEFLLSTGTLRRELELARNSDATLVVSESELEALSFKCSDADIRVLPLVCDFPGNLTTSSERDQLLFLGSFLHPPNVDAVDFLISEIWPAIRAKLSDATLNLVGEELPHRVSNRLPDGISYLGHLAHLQAELERTRVTVAPLRFGAGAKGKIAASLANGVPCVTTSIGAEGMGLVNGRDILIADTPSQFASVVRRLFDDPEFWTEMSQRGMETAQRLWAIDAVGPVFMNIVSGKEIL